jgi:uncharacterized glyoxalase superfamily protein PhnB
MRLYTQLNFGGNCEAAFRFYEQTLGGKITMLLRVRDLPPDAPHRLAPSRMTSFTSGWMSRVAS